MLLALASPPVTCDAHTDSVAATPRHLALWRRQRKGEVARFGTSSPRRLVVARVDARDNDSMVRELHAGAAQCREWDDGFPVGSLAGQRLMGFRVPESIA